MFTDLLIAPRSGFYIEREAVILENKTKLFSL
jgi:hypothetical protein